MVKRVAVVCAFVAVVVMSVCAVYTQAEVVEMLKFTIPCDRVDQFIEADHKVCACLLLLQLLLLVTVIACSTAAAAAAVTATCWYSYCCLSVVSVALLLVGWCVCVRFGRRIWRARRRFATSKCGWTLLKT